jgi:hypothetical protein
MSFCLFAEVYAVTVSIGQDLNTEFCVERICWRPSADASMRVGIQVNLLVAKWFHLTKDLVECGSQIS